MHAPLDYILQLADNSLILGHRNSEWCGHGPVLEQDIAITNISLDLIGQARNLYQYAADIRNEEETGKEFTEDSFAFFRDSEQFRNTILVELPKGDWGLTVTRQFLFSAYERLLFEQLQHSADSQLPGITGKSLKEVVYHIRWSAEWVIRLGDGTVESHLRMQQALDTLWPYTEELFTPSAADILSAKDGTGVDPSSLKDAWLQATQPVFKEAGLPVPNVSPHDNRGTSGIHTDHLATLLADMQVVARAHPGAQW